MLEHKQIDPKMEKGTFCIRSPKTSSNSALQFQFPLSLAVVVQIAVEHMCTETGAALWRQNVWKMVLDFMNKTFSPRPTSTSFRSESETSEVE